MEEERIELNAKERERLKILHEVERGHLPQIDAARRMRLSDRQVRRLLERLRKLGDRGPVQWQEQFEDSAAHAVRPCSGGTGHRVDRGALPEAKAYVSHCTSSAAFVDSSFFRKYDRL